MLKEIKRYTTFDKKALFGVGPWEGEPDKIQFIHEESGYDALIVRNQGLGNLCGYVGVPEGHPAFEKECGEIGVAVHGGLTFSNFCAPDGSEAENICHVPLPGRSDKVWWLGFDCAHGQDKKPFNIFKGVGKDVAEELKKIAPMYARFVDSGTYKTIDYVKAEIESLAYQLAGMK